MKRRARRPSVDIPEPADVDPAVENNPDKKNLRREAGVWIAANPRVYALFVRFAKEAASKGRPFGIKLLTERVRWEGLVNTTSDDGYKINNNHHAYIARRLVHDYPELVGLLRFRKTHY